MTRTPRPVTIRCTEHLFAPFPDWQALIAGGKQGPGVDGGGCGWHQATAPAPLVPPHTEGYWWQGWDRRAGENGQPLSPSPNHQASIAGWGTRDQSGWQLGAGLASGRTGLTSQSLPTACRLPSPPPMVNGEPGWAVARGRGRLPTAGEDVPDHRLGLGTALSRMISCTRPLASS